MVTTVSKILFSLCKAQVFKTMFPTPGIILEIPCSISGQPLRQDPDICSFHVMCWLSLCPVCRFDELKLFGSVSSHVVSRSICGTRACGAFFNEVILSRL